jgi:effector-binding domain-containing protein
MPRPRLAALAIGLACALAASAAPAQMPSTPTADPSVPRPLQPGDAFGKEVMLPERTLAFKHGHADWDNAFETLLAAYKALNETMAKDHLKPAGPAMTIYTETDDSGFSFDATWPVAETPKDPPSSDIGFMQAPSGRAFEFVHRGSYDAMDATYEAITNFLDGKGIDAKDQFIEEYVTDILKTPPDQLVVNIFVPVK